MYCMFALGGIVLAALINRLIGFVWFGPWLFGAQWAQLSGVVFKPFDPNARVNMLIANVGSFSFAVVTASMMYYLIRQEQIVSIVPAMVFGAALWFAFLVPAKICTVFFEQKPFSLFMINTGYDLIRLMAMAAVLVYFV